MHCLRSVLPVLPNDTKLITATVMVPHKDKSISIRVIFLKLILNANFNKLRSLRQAVLLEILLRYCLIITLLYRFTKISNVPILNQISVILVALKENRDQLN